MAVKKEPSFEALLQEFQIIYEQKLPERFKKLKPGLEVLDEEKIKAELHVEYLSDEYIQLYQWRNGFDYLKEDLDDDLGENPWGEDNLLDKSSRFLSLEDAVIIINKQEEIHKKRKLQGKFLYWKRGLVPFLEDAYYGLTVVDTIGYFGGKQGQLIYFEYNCGDGYAVVYENLYQWLRTSIEWLKRGVFHRAAVHSEIVERSRIYTEINSEYTKQFSRPIFWE